MFNFSRRYTRRVSLKTDILVGKLLVLKVFIYEIYNKKSNTGFPDLAFLFTL